MAPALNSIMPWDVRVVRSEVVDGRFHARFSAKVRTYLYVMLNREAASALTRRYAWHVREPLDVEAMRQGAESLMGEQDFAAWANGVAEVNTTVRRIVRCTVRRRGWCVLVLIEANAFLHGMVRNIVGTLVEVGAGRRKPQAVAEITESRNRALAGPTAPAHGLCLVRVRY
jgi:tRNA pseudouridine38-40 synthase